MSPLKCTVTVDSIATSHVAILSEHLYSYKGLVQIPPLTVVDDTLNISRCGLDSGLAAAHLNSQTNLKKLQYGESKYHKLHIGKSDLLCPKNTIDTWKLEKVNESASNILDMIDTEAGKHEIETVDSDKYLGQLLQNNGKNTKNIQERIKKGYGAGCEAN